MKETGIIMSGDHPKLILEGKKTMTRQVITPHNSEVGEGRVDWSKFDFYAATFANKIIQKYFEEAEEGSMADISLKDNGRAPLPWVDNSVPNWQYLHVPYNWVEHGTIYRIYPRYELGDRLWVRETHFIGGIKPNEWVTYRADGERPDLVWRSSIFMPRWASRILLEITEIRAERLIEITEKDANAEGNPYPDMGGKGSLPPIWWFKALWDSLNAKRGYGWDKNPWVWVIGFKVALQSERK